MVRTQELLEELHPEGARELERLNDAAREATDAELLELCRLRVAGMLGHPDAEASDAELSEWDRSPRFSAEERAHLALAEQFVVSVRDVGDEQIADLLEHRSPEEVRAFVSALYVVEMTQRLDLALSAAVGAR